MQSNTKTMVYAIVGLAGGLLVGLVGGVAVGLFVAKSPVADPPVEAPLAQANVDQSPAEGSRPLGNQEEIDFGNGVAFKRSTSRSTLSDGKPKMQLDSLFCDGERIWTTMSDRGPKHKNGRMMSMSFWKNNVPVLSEMDEDGDGVFEQLILLDASGPRQVFDLTNDGQILQVNKKRLEELQEAYQFGKETFAPIAEGAQKGLPKQEMRRRIEEAAEKAKEFKPASDE